jgi:hypothetical protein
MMSSEMCSCNSSAKASPLGRSHFTLAILCHVFGIQAGVVSPSLLEILRSTLARVEQSADLAPDDPALVQLRRLVLRLIAELEVAKTQKIA